MYNKCNHFLNFFFDIGLAESEDMKQLEHTDIEKAK